MWRPFSCERASRGQSIVEFAFVSLTLLLLMFGTLDLGRGVFQRVMLSNATREATRYGMIRPADPAGIREAARRTSPSLYLPDSSFAIECNRQDTVTGNWSGWSSGNCAGTGAFAMKARDLLRVCTTYQFGLSAPRLIGLNTINMRECARISVQ